MRASIVLDIGWQRIRATFTVETGVFFSKPAVRIEVSVAFSTTHPTNAPFRSSTPAGILSPLSMAASRVRVGRDRKRFVEGTFVLAIEALLHMSFATAPPERLWVSIRMSYFSPAA